MIIDYKWMVFYVEEIRLWGLLMDWWYGWCVDDIREMVIMGVYYIDIMDIILNRFIIVEFIMAKNRMISTQNRQDSHNSLQVLMQHIQCHMYIPYHLEPTSITTTTLTTTMTSSPSSPTYQHATTSPIPSSPSENQSITPSNTFNCRIKWSGSLIARISA